MLASQQEPEEQSTVIKSSIKKKTPLNVSLLTSEKQEETLNEPLKISSVLESQVPIPQIDESQKQKKTVKKKKNIFRKRDQPLDFMKAKPETVPAPPKSI